MGFKDFDLIPFTYSPSINGKKQFQSWTCGFISVFILFFIGYFIYNLIVPTIQYGYSL